MEMVKLTIDGIEVEVPKGTTVIEAARKVGIKHSKSLLFKGC
ncbi:MAG: hypothetical protein KatS3mg079_841 [Caloramator sp.]|nr:MAG: hypothetical protein KatS3mg079_841 [Caloramator sp.]